MGLEDYSSEQLIAEVRKLREENRTRREDSERYAQAFRGLDKQEQRGMLHILSIFSEDRQKGAELMQGLVDNINPRQQEEEPPVTENTEQEQETETVSTEEIPAWAKALVEQVTALTKGFETQAQTSRDQEIAEIKAYAQDLGYTPGSEAWKQLFDIASSDLGGGDLDRAHEYRTKLFPEAEGFTAGEQAEETTEETTEGLPSGPKTGHANTNGSAPAGSQEEEQKLPSLKDKAATNAGALAFLDAQESAAGTVSP